MALEWNGDDIKRQTVRAARLAIDATMSAAIIDAKSNHGAGAHAQGRFVSHTGELERGTRIVKPAKLRGRQVVGRWGVIGVIYARRIELGFQGKDSKGRTVDAPSYSYLRPAAEREYPKLAKRLKRAARF